MKLNPICRFLAASLCFGICFSMMPTKAFAYALDAVNHKITIQPVGDYTVDARNALAYLLARKDQNTTWTLHFEPGKYYITLPLYTVGLNNINVLSDPSNPAQIIKSPNFNPVNEYLFYTEMSKNVTIRGFAFYGSTSFQSNANPVWTDEGIYFGSCQNVTVDNNKFYNFGDAALRVTTSNADPVKGVHSSNTTVSNNTFNNFYQISTTSNDKIHGGTQNYTLRNNTFYNIRGSVKFASRTPGAQNIQIVSNTFNGGNHYALEINNYSNFTITKNTIANIQSVGIDIYTAVSSAEIAHGFAWGDNFTISNNMISSVGRGIRYSHDPFFDGYQYVPHHLNIQNNTINGVTETAKGVSAIDIINGKVNEVNVVQNSLNGIANKSYLTVTPGSLNVVQTGNLISGTVAAALQPITALLPTTASTTTQKPTTAAKKTPAATKATTSTAAPKS